MLLDCSLAKWLHSNISSISELLQFACVWVGGNRTDILCQKKRQPVYYVATRHRKEERAGNNWHTSVQTRMCLIVSILVFATKQKSCKADDTKKSDGMTPVSFPSLSQVRLSCQHIPPSIYLTETSPSPSLFITLPHAHSYLLRCVPVCHTRAIC